tara:strand:- start:53 stop:586 length:534 start_codon:yes stop_codon:yes gene_type:complete
MKWEQIIKRNCGCGKNPCEKYGEVKKTLPLTPEEEKLIQEEMRFGNIDRKEAEKRIRRKAGKVGQRKKVSYDDYMNSYKGEGQRHFYIKGEKPVQWTGETHNHSDGTLMSGKEHKEGVSKKLFHIEELSEKQQKHLGKNTTVIKNKELSPKQKKIAELTPPEDKIDGGDLEELREKA